MIGRALCAPIVAVLFAIHARAEAVCVDPESLAHSTVGITRYFDEAERASEPQLLGVQGTAWFLSSTTIVTAAHVATGMRLSTQDWKTLTVRDGNDTMTIGTRIQRLAGIQAEKLAVLELQTVVPGTRSVAVRPEPLVPDDHVVTLAYPNSQPRFVGGRFVQYGEGDRFSGAALFELYEGNNRLAIDHGASGAPIFDCQGRIAAVVSIALTQMVRMPSGNIRVSTAWGTPNVVSVPVQALKEFSLAR
jgi:hypothetical protein